MGLSGKLLEETNTVNGVVVKYSEPPEARKPRTRWRLYVFKGNEELPILYIHRQSAYLLGRDRKVIEIFITGAVKYNIYMIVTMYYYY